MIDILWLCGTGFGGSTPDGVSEEFRNQVLQRDPRAGTFRFIYVQYPADYGTRLTYEESLAIGRTNLLSAIENSPNPVIVGGYSQGADVAGTVARSYASGNNPGVVLGAILIADPWRPEGRSMDTVVTGVASGYGIRGEQWGYGDMPVLWAANEGDPITALPAGNPLRTLADVSQFMAASADLYGMGNALYTKVLTAVTNGRMQRWWSWSNWRTWGGALAYVRGYLVDGRHTDDYIRRGHCANLARCVVNYQWIL